MSWEISEMEGEIYNYALVWSTVILCLCYCYFVAAKVSHKGITRLCFVLPVVSLFLALPLKLHSVHLGGTTAFFVAWLANFKLLLFAFGKGPLCAHPSSLSLPSFVALACLPIKIKEHPSPIPNKNGLNNEDPFPKSNPNEKLKENPSSKSKIEEYPHVQIGKKACLPIKIQEHPSPIPHKNGRSNEGPYPKSHPNEKIKENPSSKSKIEEYPHVQIGKKAPEPIIKIQEHPSPIPHENGQNNEEPYPKSNPDEKMNENPSSRSKIEEYPQVQFGEKAAPNSILNLNYGAKVMVLGVFIRVHDYSDYIHPKIVLVLYCFHLYFLLEIILAAVAAMARTVLDLELEPQFDEPYRSTSLQDFWGRRWNLMVTSILRRTVYEPIRDLSSRAVGRRLAPLPAVMATFAASAVMHELMVYYIGRVRPTWEITWFFVLHGTCLVVEIAMKKLIAGRFRLPGLVSGVMTVGFVMSTGFWLFFPQFLRCKADVRAFDEYAAAGSFMRDVGVAVADWLNRNKER